MANIEIYHHPTFDEYIMEVEVATRDNPQWRWGQTYYNVLIGMRQDLADKVCAGPLDPYYKEAHELGAFIAWVAENW